MSVEMVAFDVAGTVLNDDGLVISAFKKAFEATQPDLWPTHGEQWTQYAIDTMGQSKSMCLPSYWVMQKKRRQQMLLLKSLT